MADQKISLMTESGAFTGAELVEIVQDGGTFRTTTQDVANLSSVDIAALDAAGALTGPELVWVKQDGANVQTTAQDIADLAGGGGGNTVNDYATSDTITGSQTATNIGAGGDILLTVADDPIGTAIKACVVASFAILVIPITGTSILFWDGATAQIISDAPLSYLYMTDVGMSATF